MNTEKLNFDENKNDFEKKANSDANFTSSDFVSLGATL